MGPSSSDGRSRETIGATIEYVHFLRALSGIIVIICDWLKIGDTLRFGAMFSWRDSVSRFVVGYALTIFWSTSSISALGDLYEGITILEMLFKFIMRFTSMRALLSLIILNSSESNIGLLVESLSF